MMCICKTQWLFVCLQKRQRRRQFGIHAFSVLVNFLVLVAKEHITSGQLLAFPVILLCKVHTYGNYVMWCHKYNDSNNVSFVEDRNRVVNKRYRSTMRYRANFFYLLDSLLIYICVCIYTIYICAYYYCKRINSVA